MSEKKVYLCGPINGRSDDDCRNWREDAKARLRCATLDPMDRDYRGRELEPGIAAEIVENDKRDIEQCAAMLVYYDQPSVGTSMEVLYAHNLGLPVVLVDVSKRPLSPWLLYHATQIERSLNGAITHLNDNLLSEGD
jgi:nucleoside 2-deoxyribosyltransferase